MVLSPAHAAGYEGKTDQSKQIHVTLSVTPRSVLPTIGATKSAIPGYASNDGVVWCKRTAGALS